MPTTPRFRCSIPAEAGPRPAGCGPRCATNARSGPRRRPPPSIATRPTARPSMRMLCSPAVAASCMPTATPASPISTNPSRTTGVPRLTEVACWAHARRKIYDVHVETGSPAAREALERIARLFAVEADIRGRSPAERREARQRRSRADPGRTEDLPRCDAGHDQRQEFARRRHPLRHCRAGRRSPASSTTAGSK